MARVLIVGCGCRGREIGTALREAGWEVRGTSRSGDGLRAIEAAGLDSALADPDQPGTILDLVGDVTVVLWLLGSVSGARDDLAAMHGPRLERLLEKLVDTPVRGFVYEATGTAGAEHLAAGAAIVRTASARWRIPATVVDSAPDGPRGWAEAVTGAASAGSA